MINDSLGAARAWDGQPIRLLYLDADHSYEQARKDFEAWHRWVVPGGVIAFHDAIEPGWPDMSRLLDERLLDGNWILHRVVASIVYAVRQDQSLTADKLSPASFERGIFTTLREAKGSEIELRRYIGHLHSEYQSKNEYVHHLERELQSLHKHIALLEQQLRSPHSLLRWLWLRSVDWPTVARLHRRYKHISEG